MADDAIREAALEVFAIVLGYLPSMKVYGGALNEAEPILRRLVQQAVDEAERQRNVAAELIAVSRLVCSKCGHEGDLSGLLQQLYDLIPECERERISKRAAAIRAREGE